MLNLVWYVAIVGITFLWVLKRDFLSELTFDNGYQYPAMQNMKESDMDDNRYY